MDPREFLEYDPDTGKLYWKIQIGNYKKAGDEAGYVNQKGYLSVKIKGRSYTGHRLCWFLYNNMWPSGIIDHINGIKHDNRISNLRDTDYSTNNLNRFTPQSNTGFVGVNYRECKNKYRAYFNGKHLGYFDDLEKAIEVYQQHREEYFKEV